MMNWLEEIELDEIEIITATEETTEERNERFKITDLASMNWALRKLSALQKVNNEDLLLFHSEIYRIEQWFRKQNEANKNSVDFLEGLVKEYATTQRVIDPKWKSKTPYGLVSFRKQQPKWEYGDEEALTKYLADSRWDFENGCVRTKQETDKNKLKELITTDKFRVGNGKLVNALTGEIISGVTITERDPIVTIKLEG